MKGKGQGGLKNSSKLCDRQNGGVAFGMEQAAGSGAAGACAWCIWQGNWAKRSITRSNVASFRSPIWSGSGGVAQDRFELREPVGAI